MTPQQIFNKCNTLQQGKKSRAVRYSAAAGLDEDVFLHPNSTLHSTAPEFVVYAELIRTAKRPYMAGGWVVGRFGAAQGCWGICERCGRVHGAAGCCWVPSPCKHCPAAGVLVPELACFLCNPTAGVTAIEPQWLPDVAAPLCTFSQPLAEPAPFYKPAADKVSPGAQPC